jgi:microcystin-dependent protein
MAISLKHSFNCAKLDGLDTTVVQPSDWNAEHALTAASGKVLGTVSNSTTVSELPLSVDPTGQSIILPSGTTAQRPTPAAGMTRFNTDLGKYEYYSGAAWKPVDNVQLSTGQPSDPVTGELWVDTDANNALTVYNGSNFVSPWATPLDGSVTTAKIVDANVTLAKLAAAVQALLVPAGVVSPYAGTSEPTGWLFARGQAVSRSTYAALFAAIGTTYGVGDGSTTFNLPDLRGRVAAGKDDMGGTSANRLTNQSGGLDGDVLGASGGAETHTLTVNELASHTHTITAAIRTGSAQSGSGDNECNNVNLTTNSTGGSQAHNNVQPTIILNYIIKT